MNADTITLGIAIWGAFFSTVAILWNWYRDISNKGKLRVNCYIGLIAQPGVGIHKEDVLIWTVTNVGRQSVMLTHIGGKLKHPEHFVALTHNPLPQMLQPGEYFTDYMEDFSNLDTNNLNALMAVSSLGKEYKAPKKQVKQIREKILELKKTPKSSEDNKRIKTD